MKWDKMIFEGIIIALDLGYTVGFKKKSELRKKIVENGGTISYIVTRKCSFVVTSDPEKVDVSSKCRMAVKYGLPVLSLDYVWDCLRAGALYDTSSYVVGGKSSVLDFKAGKISALKNKEEKKKVSSRTSFNPRTTRIWHDSDSDTPEFDENAFEIAKYAFFSGFNKQLKCEQLQVVELQAVPRSRGTDSNLMEVSGKEDVLKFRVVLQTGSWADLKDGKVGHREYRFLPTADKALAVFAMVCEDAEKRQGSKSCLPPRGVGSQQLQKYIAEKLKVDEGCSDEVKDVVEHVWREAMSEVNSVLGNISGIKVEQVEQAEAILIKIREAIKGGKSEIVVLELIKEFYSTLPHKQESSNITKDQRARWLVRKQDMCQLIKDMTAVSEMTNFETRADVVAKYAALRCHIKHLAGTSHMNVENMVISSLEGKHKNVSVANVFEIWRQEEDMNFRHDLDPKQLLFHCSKVENFVGILSRGLLLPKVVVDDYGGTRTDAGMLGSGIYFASAASTSMKYSMASKTKGSRLLLVSEVALGRVKDYTSHDTTLTGPPEGYDSTHGVSKVKDSSSAFEDDEYVVYNVAQQRLRYLVEFTLPEDSVCPIIMVPTEPTLMQDTDTGTISMSDVTDIANPLAKVKAGLQGSGDADVELRGVHIRAKLLDLAAQVVVLQEYVNNSSKAIEAKYVFPLDDAAVVCGFEAFINGKHIVGEVKEKEKAHREYREAISQGHGAYLMDQEETPDVFTVSVGNLPAGACVLIKITYVAELQVDQELIDFKMPASVAPWREDAAFKQNTQNDLQSEKVSSASKTSVQVAVEMPFDIRTLDCPTHKVKIKQTASKAYLEVVQGQAFGSGFQLLIGLAEIHVPRMWVERLPNDEQNLACMLTFYPEFETSELTDGELLLVLDTSNSMKGKPLTDAKKVALLALAELPPDWHFNVARFGSDYEELFPGPLANTAENMEKAAAFIQESVANMGSTCVQNLLQAYQLLPRSDAPRNIFLVSDGHINSDNFVLRLASESNEHLRVFTFGVSDTCNNYWLKSLSRVSGGAFEFFDTKTKSKWEPKVKGQMSKACQAGLTSVSVEWCQHDNLPALQAPEHITSLFNGSRQVVYGFVPNCTMAVLKAKVGGQEVSTVVSTSELSITEGLLVHRLTARALIRDFEDGVLSTDRTQHEVAKMNLKSTVIDLSKEYSIVTQFTSFIAVEKREENEKDLLKTGPSMAELVDKEGVDILDYMGWTEVPKDEPPAFDLLLEEISEQLRMNRLSVNLMIQLDTVENQYQQLRQEHRACSPDVLRTAEVLTDAYLYQGKDDMALSVAESAYRDAHEGMRSLVEKEEYAAAARGLERLRQRVNQRETGRLGYSLPLPKYVDGGSVTVVTMSGKTMAIPCCGETTVLELKRIIWEREGSPIEQQRLVYDGIQCEDQATLHEYHVADSAKIYLVQRLRGGGAAEAELATVGSNVMEERQESESDEDMGMGLFDAEICSASPRKMAEPEAEESESEPDIGFGLFDDDTPAVMEKHDDKAKGILVSAKQKKLK
ncbi:protein mono-ADP-ribosyltransferase PARP4, partial [Aplysia californica]|uniref:Poly [ADP-ribose] polymerase n=1 Tax=Aplysia californica TaxID=6500 RepID=A0ABM0ZY58_APLCA